MIRALARPLVSPLARAVTAGAPTWMPLGLFRAGEQGIWLDPSDLSTLFQDAAGTVPVTAAGQPVGRILDKSGRGNHASQPTAARRPILRQNATTGAYFLGLDGVDDGLVTASMDFTATDKVSVFAGVRKLSDAAAGIVCELGAVMSANSGTMALIVAGAGGAEEYTYGSRGSVAQYAATSLIAHNAPHSGVLTCSSHIAGDSAILRVNGAQAAQNTADQGTGNYGNYPLYIGRRGGTTLPFNGHLYGLIITGRLATDRETRATERLLARRTGVVLA